LNDGSGKTIYPGTIDRGFTVSINKYYFLYLGYIAAGIAQTVQRRVKGWTTEGSEFEFRGRKYFSPLHIVQTGSGAHPAS
jgi:hypothetical protein